MYTLNKVQARITVLTPEQIDQVHTYTLNVLSTTGIRVDSVRARAVFSKAIGNSFNGNRVRIPADLVECALKSTPSSIELFDRIGKAAFCLSGTQNLGTYFGIGVTNLWYQDPETDMVLPFSRKHIEISTRLGETLNSFDVSLNRNNVLGSTKGIIHLMVNPECRLSITVLL